eukprot:1152253-Pelagomonas_calceolata.AAC.1
MNKLANPKSRRHEGASSMLRGHGHAHALVKHHAKIFERVLVCQWHLPNTKHRQICPRGIEVANCGRETFSQTVWLISLWLVHARIGKEKKRKLRRQRRLSLHQIRKRRHIGSEELRVPSTTG